MARVILLYHATPQWRVNDHEMKENSTPPHDEPVMDCSMAKPEEMILKVGVSKLNLEAMSVCTNHVSSSCDNKLLLFHSQETKESLTVEHNCDKPTSLLHFSTPKRVKKKSVSHSQNQKCGYNSLSNSSYLTSPPPPRKIVMCPLHHSNWAVPIDRHTLQGSINVHLVLVR